MVQGPDGGMKKLSEDTIVSMNFWGFTPALFDQLEQGLARFLTERGEDAGAEYFLPAMVSDCIHAGDARQLNGTWRGWCTSSGCGEAEERLPRERGARTAPGKVRRCHRRVLGR